MKAAPTLPTTPDCSANNPEHHEITRYHHLDAVRAFALLLGVVFHAAESFGPRNFYWAIVDQSTSQFVEWVRFACHSFRMELFFVIAGFFARLMILRRGTAGFVKNRFQRILLPLVIGWVLLYPLLVFIWLWGRSNSGNLADLGIPPEARDYPLWALWLGFFMAGGFLQKFDLTHLWFLHQLLTIYVLWLGGLWLARRFDPSRRGVAGIERAFSACISTRWAVLWFALAATPWLFMMKDWGVDTPKESLIPELPTTLLFGFCFFAGWFLHRRPHLLDALTPRWPWLIGLGVCFAVALGIVDRVAPFRTLSPATLRWVHVGYILVYSAMMWSFVLGFLGLFTRFFSRPSAATRYVADSSYWLYIAHLPLVVALQVLVAKLPFPWFVKIPGILLIAFSLLFLSYHYLVRGTFIGKFLNGRKYPAGKIALPRGRK